MNLVTPWPPELLMGPSEDVNELIAQLRLVDHHTHSVLRGLLTPDELILAFTESDRPSVAAHTRMASQVGVAARRWCAPLFGLEPGADEEEYLRARSRISNEGAVQRVLPRARVARLIIETGFRSTDLVDPFDFGRLAGAEVSTVVRLEAVAESLAAAGVGSGDFVTAYREALELAGRAAVGVKSIIAYRYGLDFDPSPPSLAAVEESASTWLRGVTASAPARLTDPVLLRFVLWEGVRLGKPVQIHTGYGDPDLDLARCDPLLLTDFIRRTEDRCQIVLLHTYPFHRHAGYLAQMYPHVYMDVGLAINYTGARSTAIIAESLELAPFDRLLYSSDAWGLPELHLLGSWLFRRGLSEVVGTWVARGDWLLGDARDLLARIGHENASQLYALPATSPAPPSGAST